MTCEKEIASWLEKMDEDTPLYSLLSIEQYIEYAKEKDLLTGYFPVVDCGFLVYNDLTIFLTSEDGGTVLSTTPNLA